jgi:disulfide bond formation protein DsbB
MNETLLKIISLGAILIIIGLLIHIIFNFFSIKKPTKKIIELYRLELLFLISLMGTVGSLLLSIYFKLAACELCWYQRVFLFCIPIIAAVALIKKDIKAHVYIFWLSFVGMLFALYHTLIQTKIFTSDAVFCDPNAIVNCAIPAFTYYGFVTVPVISLALFLLLLTISYEHKNS